MSEFSEYLDRYMNEIKISSAELSEELGVERTAVYRYRKGSRVPVNEEMVVQMAQVLQMSVPERDEFIEKYDYLNIGETVVNSYQYICELLKRIKNAEKETTVFTFREIVLSDRYEEPNFAMSTEDEVLGAMSTLFEDVKQGGGQSLMLIMQPVYETVQRMIQAMFQGTEVQIEQIVCLEQSTAKNYKNLQVLQLILPLCFDNVNYDVRYYYDFLSHHINGMSWMPNVIISEKQVIMSDYEMKYGILIREAGIVQMMREKFAEIKKFSQPLVERISGALKVMEAYNEIGNTVIADIPCMGPGISSDIYEEFLFPFPEKKEFIRLMSDWNGDWEGKIFVEPESSMREGTISFCKLESIRSFMETGRVREFPDGFYRPLDMNVRKKILWRCIQLIRMGRLKYYILPDEVEVPNDIYCYVGEESKITLSRIYENGMTKLEICEQSIYKVFKNFMEYMEKKGLLSDREEVVKSLEEIAKEYR